MKLLYEKFYRQTGVMNPNKLGLPRICSITNLDLPQNSIFHYVNMDADSIGMPPESEYTRNKKSQVGVFFQQRFTTNNPLSNMPFGVTGLKRHSLYPIENEFFQTHPRYKNLKRNMNLAAEKNNLVVHDYTLLPQTVVYRENRPYFWNRWTNMYTTMLDNINDLSTKSMRQHFFEINVPELIPPLSIMNLIDKDYSMPTTQADGIQIRQDLWKRFANYDLLCIMDLWIWLGTYRNKSKLAQLSETARKRTNIIFRAGSKYVVLSLDRLDSWLMKADSNDPKARLPSRVAKYRLLGLLMALNNQRNTVNIDAEDEDLVIDEGLAESQDLDVLAEQSAPKEKPKSDITEVFGVLAPTVRRLDVDLNRTNGSTADDVKINVSAAPLTAQTTVAVKPGDLSDVNKASVADNNDDQLLIDMSDDAILKELEQLEFTYKQAEINEIEGMEYEAYIPPSIDPEEAIYREASAVAGKALLSEAELRRLVKKSGNYKTIDNPFGGTGTLAEAIDIKPEEIIINEHTPLAKDILGVTDKSMLSSSIAKMNSQYVENILHKDIGNVFLSLQQAGIIIEDYKVSHVENYTDSYDVHTVRLVPVRGQASTLNIRIPTVRKDGTFFAGGVRYRMRTQRGDLPIRKTAPNKVALTSYYSKMFVTRSERMVYNYASWITKKIIEIGWSDDPLVTELTLADVSNRDYNGARTYSAIATRIASFISKGYHFNFDSTKINEIWPSRPKLTDITPLAYNAANKDTIFIDDHNELLRLVNGRKVSMGMNLEQWLGLDPVSAPLDIAEVKLYGKPIPIGIILAQHTGLGSLMKTLNTQYRVVKKGTNVKLAPHEYAVRFEDETLVLDRRDRLSTLIIGGFNRYHQHIKQHSRYAFDKRDVYGVIFENAGIGSRKTRDIDFMFKMWVDHITRDLLVEMEMPTNLFEIYIEACRLLMTDAYSEETDVAFMRDRGYERFAGMLYSELLTSVKAFNNRPNALNASVQVNPLAVWMGIQVDQSVTAVDESNPIQSLKDLEVVVFTGEGGRSTVSMTAPTRVFHPNSMGITSEATVDNGDAGAITFTSADPNYTSVRGRTRRLQTTDGSAAKVISTSMLLAPGADMDDPKRVNFLSIQNSQSTFANGYTPVPLRTGYERVLGMRTGDLYCKTATRDGGVVKSIKDSVITIGYPDGTTDTYPIGRVFGKWSGEIVPHNLVTDLKVGETVKEGQAITYNSHYFQPDSMDPTAILYKNATLARTVFWEASETLEDSCGITESFAKRLVTRSTEIRNIRVEFTQEVRNLLAVGTTVDSNTILCTIYEPMTGAEDIYEDDALDTLTQISSLNPTAKVRGVIERIEVIYSGELDHMTPSLQQLVSDSDRLLYRKNRQLGLPISTGQVEPGYRIDNNAMGNDSVIIKVYITRDVDMGVADKLVVGHQMKATVGSVLPDTLCTADGDAIDVISGYDALLRRMVLSVEFMGTTNTLLMKLNDMALAAYDSDIEQGE